MGSARCHASDGPSPGRTARAPAPGPPRRGRATTKPGGRRRRRSLGLERLQRHRLGRDRRDGGTLGTAAYYAASAASAKDDVNQFLRYQDPVTGVPLEYHTVAARYESSIRDGQHDDRVAKGALIVAAGTAMVATAFFIIDSVRTPEAPRRERPPASGHADDAGLRPGAAPRRQPHDGVLGAAVELLMRRVLLSRLPRSWRSQRWARRSRPASNRTTRRARFPAPTRPTPAPAATPAAPTTSAMTRSTPASASSSRPTRATPDAGAADRQTTASDGRGQ